MNAPGWQAGGSTPALANAEPRFSVERDTEPDSEAGAAGLPAPNQREHLLRALSRTDIVASFEQVSDVRTGVCVCVCVCVCGVYAVFPYNLRTCARVSGTWCRWCIRVHDVCTFICAISYLFGPFPLFHPEGQMEAMEAESRAEGSAHGIGCRSIAH